MPNASNASIGELWDGWRPGAVDPALLERQIG